MASVRKQLGESSKMPAMKRRSFIRSAAKCAIGKIYDEVISMKTDKCSVDCGSIHVTFVTILMASLINTLLRSRRLLINSK